VQHAKTGTNIPNNLKYTKWPQNISNYRKIDQLIIEYTNIFHFKTLQNLPKLGFLVSKYAIWQPRSLGAEGCCETEPVIKPEK
jgi:hypothetical protein